MNDTLMTGVPAEGYALTPEQRLALAQGGDAGSIHIVLRLRDDTDPERMRQAVMSVGDRYDVLGLRLRNVRGFRSMRQFPAERNHGIQWHEVQSEAIDTTAFLRDWISTHRVANSDMPDTCTHAILIRGSEGGLHLGIVVSPVLVDEGSLLRLGEAIVTRYDELNDASGQRPGLDDDPLAYLDFAGWRDEVEADGDALTGRKYWRDYIASSTQSAEGFTLPSRLHASTATVSGVATDGTVEQRIDGAIGRRLLQYARAHNLAPELVPQAAWWALLARISDAEAVCGMIVHDCRTDYEPLSGSLGVYQRLLPVALQMDRQESFVSLVCRLNGILDEHRHWQEYCPADLGQMEAFLGTGYVWLDDFAPRQAGQSTIAVPAAMSGFRGNIALRMRVILERDGTPVSATIEYSDLEYDGATVAALLEQYITFLANIPSDGTQPLDTVSLVSATERSRLLSWRGPQIAFADRTILDRLDLWATQTPHAPALVSEDRNLGYGELVADIDRVASALSQAGVEAGNVVGVFMPRSGSLVLGLLASMRAGGAYLPLDIAWPVSRMLHIIENAGARVILCTRAERNRLAAELPDTVTCVVLDDALGDADSGSPFTAPVVSPEQAAYVMYTSGSTGSPKGVIVEHRHLLNYAAAVSDALDLSRCHRYALTSTVAADLGNTTLYGAIYNGGCLVVAAEDDMSNGRSFARFVGSSDVDCIKVVPSHLEALLEGTHTALPGTIVLGGEAASTALITRIRSIAPQSRIFNHYGPTETTVGVLVHAVEQGKIPAVTARLPLTRVLANCRAYVLDSAHRLVPVGVTGYLHIGGAQVCRGYVGLGQGGTFVSDPFVNGEMLYNTGDRARYLPCGGIELLGRGDDQIKIHGFRVELGEIEDACLLAPGVRQAVARVCGEDTRAQIVVYLVSDNEGESRDDVRAHLRKLLPDAMIPSHLVFLDSMPRLANGKIDRRSLPSPSLGEQELVTPRNAVETVIANIAADLLGRQELGVTTSFFDLGGDSLLVIRLVSRIAEQLRIEVLPGVVFAHPSVAALATALTAAESAPGKLERVAQLRIQLDAMTPVEKAALLAQVRHEKQSTGMATECMDGQKNPSRDR